MLGLMYSCAAISLFDPPAAEANSPSQRARSPSPHDVPAASTRSDSVVWTATAISCFPARTAASISSGVIRSAV